jgi:ADP-ribose pyrophosphatase YjhB (NUDIX family)
MTDDDHEFLESYDPAKFDRPSVTVDLVLMSVRDGALYGLVMRRAAPPAKGKWALPGGFVRMDESLDEAARRILREKAHIASAYLEQLYTFGAVDRDPRTRIITVAYFALLPAAQFDRALKASGQLSLARITTSWKGEAGGRADAHGSDGAKLALAFDHADILGLAVKRLRGKLDYSHVGFELLPTQFTLRALQDVHEAILGVRFNKPAFRRRMLDKGVLEATGRREQGAAFRPAELFRFSENRSSKTTRKSD